MQENEYHKMFFQENNHWWFIGRAKIINSYLSKIYNIKNNLQILDIGSGTGSNINLLKNYGNLSILEPSEVGIKYLKKKINNNIKLKKGKCPLDLDYKEKFDLICLFDVLEHIEEDEETINRAINIINDNGRIFITVPAYNLLWSKHDKNLMHKRRYNKKKLKYIIKNKLEIEYLTHFNTLLFPLAIIDRFIKKFYFNANIKKKPYFNYFLEKIFSFEKYLLNFFNFPFGLSILLILKKNNK